MNEILCIEAKRSTKKEFRRDQKNSPKTIFFNRGKTNHKMNKFLI